MPNFNGSSGDDIFTGGASRDTAVGNRGNDELSGDGGGDLLVGGAGSDTLLGGADEDTLYSNEESDPYRLPYYDNPFTPPQLDTLAEVDNLDGGEGDDIIFAGYGDNVDGGADGYTGDYLFISFLGAATTGVTVDFSLETQTVGGGVITGIENVSWIQGSRFDDVIDAGSRSGGYSHFTVVEGMGGNDQLIAGYYTGNLYGGDGDDIVDGRGSQYLQSATGGAGNDTIYAKISGWSDTYGDAGDDTIHAGGGRAYGGDGDDVIHDQHSGYSAVLFGDAGDDVINGDTEGMVGSGGQGSDSLTGSGQADTLYSAGSGELYQLSEQDDIGLEHDVLAGFGGDDVLWAGYGDDVDGGSGSDSLNLSFGGRKSGVTLDTTGLALGEPFMLGGGIIDNIETLLRIRGSNYADILTIGAQKSLLEIDAGAGDDVVTSGASSVSLLGGAGADRLISGAAGDIFDGGKGIDTVDYHLSTSAVTVDLRARTGARGDKLIAVENVVGSNFGDSLKGDDGANQLEGLAGADKLDGGKGQDTMIGGAGNDSYYVDNTLDKVVEVDGGGSDTVFSTIGFSLAGRYVENLTLTGSSAINGAGNGLANVLVGNGAANVLDGGKGADKMTGGGGADTYVVDNAKDVVVEANVAGVDTVNSAVTWTLGAYVENLVLTGAKAVNGTGNGLTNVLTGNGAANALNGGAGDDRLIGGVGADVLTGGAGKDVFVYAAASASTTAAFDRITDLTKTDKIDLSGIDASTKAKGDQAFKIVDAFTKTAGQMTLDYSSKTKLTTILMDVNGDGKADMKIVVNGDHDDFVNFVF